MRTTVVNHEAENLHIVNVNDDLSYRQTVLRADYSNLVDPQRKPGRLQEADVLSLHDTARVINTLGGANNMNSFQELRICLTTQRGFTVVKLADIVYCEAQRSYTQFHLLGNKSITVSKPLFEYDRLLSDANFIRVHKSFFINLFHMKEYTRGEGGTVLMSNGMEIDVSRRRKELFLNKIKEAFRYTQ